MEKHWKCMWQKFWLQPIQWKEWGILVLVSKSTNSMPPPWDQDWSGIYDSLSLDRTKGGSKIFFLLPLEPILEKLESFISAPAESRARTWSNLIAKNSAVPPSLASSKSFRRIKVCRLRWQRLRELVWRLNPMGKDSTGCQRFWIRFHSGSNSVL